MTNSGAVPLTKPSRIRVHNFEPMQQARIWREQGHLSAIRSLIGMLRTAVLFGEKLVLDRNDLWDGIFFLSLGPDGIARALGVEQWERLPLTLLTAPPRDSTSRNSLESRLQDQMDIVNSQQYMRASSALLATYHSSAHLHDQRTAWWLLPDPAGSWFPGAGLTDSFHPFRSTDEATSHLKGARELWAEAASQDRFSVVDWQPWASLPLSHDGRSPMRKALDEQLEELGGGATRLTRELLHTVETTERKQAVVFLNSRLASGYASGDDCRTALDRWSRAYNQALAWKDDCRLLAFSSPQFEAGGSSADGISPRKASGRRQTDDQVTGRIRINGEILGNMERIGPSNFRELVDSEAAVVSRASNGDRRGMNDLALASRRAINRRVSHRTQLWLLVARSLVLSLLVLIVGILTVAAELTSVGTKLTLVIVAAAVSALASMPWSDLIESRSLREDSLSADLEFRMSGMS